MDRVFREAEVAFKTAILDYLGHKRAELEYFGMVCSPSNPDRERLLRDAARYETARHRLESTSDGNLRRILNGFAERIANELIT